MLLCTFGNERRLVFKWKRHELCFGLIPSSVVKIAFSLIIVSRRTIDIVLQKDENVKVNPQTCYCFQNLNRTCTVLFKKLLLFFHRDELMAVTHFFLAHDFREVTIYLLETFQTKN